MKSSKGFSVAELLVVMTIITLLLGIVIASVTTIRARSRDAQTRTEKQTIILALVRAREASPTKTYPGLASTWQCIKSSGTCWQGGRSGNTTITNALQPFMPGGVFPLPPSRSTSERRHGGYLLNPTPSTVGASTGSFLVWAQEKAMTAADCNGEIVTFVDEPGMFYCYELLPR